MGKRLEETIFYQGERHAVKRGWLVVLLASLLTGGTLLLLPFASMFVEPDNDMVVITPVHSVKLPPKKKEKPRPEKKVLKKAKSENKSTKPKLQSSQKSVSPMVDIPLVMPLEAMDFTSNVSLKFALAPSAGELETPDLGSLIFEIDQVDTNPEKISGMDPQMPFRATSRGISGYVKTTFVVNSAGKVGDIKVIEAKPKGVFERTVIRALSKYTYKPGTKDGQMVATRVRKKFEFKVE